MLVVHDPPCASSDKIRVFGSATATAKMVHRQVIVRSPDASIDGDQTTSRRSTAISPIVAGISAQATSAPMAAA